MVQGAVAAHLLIHWINIIYFGCGLLLQMSNAHFIQLVKCNRSYKWIQILKEKMSMLTHSALLFLHRVSINWRFLQAFGKTFNCWLCMISNRVVYFLKEPIWLYLWDKNNKKTFNITYTVAFRWLWCKMPRQLVYYFIE